MGRVCSARCCLKSRSYNGNAGRATSVALISALIGALNGYLSGRHRRRRMP